MQATAKQRQRALLPRGRNNPAGPPQGLVHVQGVAESGRDLRQQRQAVQRPRCSGRNHVELVVRWSATRCAAVEETMAGRG